VSLAIVAVDALRRVKSSDGRVRFDGVGLELHVADAGNLGGGISFCFDACCGGSATCEGLCACAACDAWDAALDELRRQPLKLSLRLNEVADEGVSGSVEVEVWVDVVSFFVRARILCTFIFCSSMSVSLSLNSPLGRE
jgi:hypothetical protein